MTTQLDGWHGARLGDVARWGSGGTPNTKDRSLYGGSIPWVVIGDLTDGPVHETADTITEAGLARSSAKLIPPGAVLVAMYGASIGRLGITTREATTNQAIAHAIPHRSVDAKYLLYYLMSQKRQLVAAGQGAAQPNIGQGVLKAWPISFPRSLDEQRRIVDLLDDHLSRLDAAETDLRSATLKQDALWLSILAAARADLAASPRRTIGTVATTSLGKMLDAKKQTGAPTPYLRNINVRWGSFDLEDVQLTPLTERDIARFDIHPGDVMVCEGGEPGRCAVWREPLEGLAFQKALHRIRVHSTSEVLPEFLCLMLTEAVRSGRTDHLLTGTTIKHLPQEKLRTIEIPVPTLALQRNTLSRITEIDAARARMSLATSVARRRSAALRRSVLAAAFSGRLAGGREVDHPEEETAG